MSKFYRNEQIYEMYFERKMSFTDISKVLNISISQISRIVHKDENYIQEKNKRKAENIAKHIEYTKKFIKEKRESKTREINYDKEILDFLHNQASCELSARKIINNRAFRDWNSSIYKFNNKTKEYRLKDEFKDITSYAVPKKIKWSGG